MRIVGFIFLLGLGLILNLGSSHAAGSKISDLADGTPLLSTDNIPMQRGAGNVKGSMTAVTSYVYANSPGSTGQILYNNSGVVASATLSTLGIQPLDADLTALAGATTAADKMWYWTGSATGSLISTTSFGRSVLNVADASAARTLFNVTDSELKPTEAWCQAISDESTALTVGTSKLTFRAPYAFTLTDIRGSVKTAPTGAILIVDVNEGGTTVMSTNKLSVDASEKTSTTAATAPGLTDTSIADDAELTIDIDQVGSTVAGAGAKVCLIGHKT